MRPKALHRGTLFDGLLDCYVLDDERRVVSNRGAVKALTGGGRERGDLGAYLGKLPKQHAHLALAAEIEFSLPTGGTAKGHEATWLVDLLRAYDEAADCNQLHHTQMHLALNARKVLRALAGVAIIALVDEATGYEKHRRAAELSFAFRAILLESQSGWDLMWPTEFVEAVCRLHGTVYTGGPQPKWLASTYDKLYHLVLGDDVCAELKRRNPEPRHGTNHHQWLTPEARNVVSRQVPVLTAFAGTCASKEEFWARVEHHYRGRPLQLSVFPVSRGEAAE